MRSFQLQASIWSSASVAEDFIITSQALLLESESAPSAISPARDLPPRECELHWLIQNNIYNIYFYVGVHYLSESVAFAKSKSRCNEPLAPRKNSTSREG